MPEHEITLQLLRLPAANWFSSKVINPGEGVVVKSWGSAESYLSDPDDRITTYSYPCIETFESSSFGDGRIISNATPDSSTPFVYEYFLKDHLGSTRMVINDEGTPTEMVSYMPYGSMTDVGGASSAGLPVREKFTGKEFDTEGEDSVSGVGGIQAYYFGARYFDPEVGVWGATDPKRQFWNGYAYAGNGRNPIFYRDFDGLELRLYYSPTLGGIGYHVFLYSTELHKGKGMQGFSGVASGEGWEEEYVKDPETFYVVIDDLKGMTEKEAFEKIDGWDGWNDGHYMFFVNDCHKQMQDAFDYAGLDYPTEGPGRVKDVGPLGELALGAASYILYIPLYRFIYKTIFASIPPVFMLGAGAAGVGAAVIGTAGGVVAGAGAAAAGVGAAAAGVGAAAAGVGAAAAGVGAAAAGVGAAAAGVGAAAAPLIPLDPFSATATLLWSISR